MSDSTLAKLNSLIKQKFKIFPVNKNEKTPIENGYRDSASYDQDQIKKWLKLYPGCNWGMILKDSGLIAIDIDPRNGGDETWFDLLITNGFTDDKEWIQETPSGGQHYIYKALPALDYKGTLGKGIDVKHKGYILVAPSSIYKKAYTSNDGELRNLPEWLLDKIIKKVPVANDEGKAKGNFTDEYLEFLVTEIKEKTSLDYNQWFSVICACKNARGEDGLKYAAIATQNQNSQSHDIALLKEKWPSIKASVFGGITERYLEKVLNDFGVDYDFSFEGEKFRSEWFEWGLGKATTKVETALEIIENEFAYIGGKFYRKTLNDGLYNLEAYTLAAVKFYFGDRPYIQQNKNGKWVEHNPIDLYKKFVNKKKFNSIYFGPPGKAKEFNLFDHFPYEAIIVGAIAGDVKWEKCLRPIKDTIKSICGGNKVACEWLVKWCAHILQHPWEHVPTVPVLYGEQGTGKTLFVESILGAMLGPFFCGLNAEEIGHRFNSDMAGKFLVCVDEAFKGDHSVQSKLKKLSGNTTMRVEYKSGGIFHIKKYFRLIMTTNSSRSVNIEKGNRRYVVFKSTITLNKKEWAHIAEEIKKKEVLEQFYKFLIEIDLKGFNPNICPDFGMGEDIVAESGDSFEQFIRDSLAEDEEYYLKWFLEKNGFTYIIPSIIFTDYTAWCGESGVRNYTTKTAFTQRVRGLFECNTFSNKNMESVTLRVDGAVIRGFKTTTNIERCLGAIS